MVHTVLKVAKALPPSIVLIGEAETVWISGKKKVNPTVVFTFTR